MSLALTILSLPRSDLLPAALLRNQLSSIQYHRLNPPFQNGNLHSVLMVLVKQSVVIQCPPLGSFSHQADPTTDSLFDGSFVRSFGRSVGRYVRPRPPPSFLPSLFPYAAPPPPSVPLTSPSNVNLMHRKARANTDSGIDRWSGV